METVLARRPCGCKRVTAPPGHKMNAIDVLCDVHKRWSSLESRRSNLIAKFRRDMEALDHEFMRELYGKHYDSEDIMGGELHEDAEILH